VARRIDRSIVTAAALARVARESIAAKIAIWAVVVNEVADLAQRLEDWMREDFQLLVAWVLRRIGLPWLPGDELTKENLSRAISEVTGVTFRDITDGDTVKEDVELYARQRFEEATGVAVEKITQTYIQKAIKEAVLRELSQRSGNGLMAVYFLFRCQKAARESAREQSFDRLAHPFSECLRRWNKREAQRMYGTRHIQVWDEWANLCVRNAAGRVFVRVKAERVRRAWRRNNKTWRALIKGKPPPYQIASWVNPSEARDNDALRPFVFMTKLEWERLLAARRRRR
jgi:hypothetical protein